MFMWILFSNGVDRHSRYSESELDWLAERIGVISSRYAIEDELRDLPLGEMKVIEGRQVVKIKV